MITKYHKPNSEVKTFKLSEIKKKQLLARPDDFQA